MGKKMAILILLTGLLMLYLLFFHKDQQGQTSAGNPDTAMVETGRYLFFDTRLSHNNSKSCGSCHDPKFAFTDGYRRSITANGDNVKHNAPSLVNVVFHHYFDWANPNTTTLEKQHERPLFNENPPELGAKGNEKLILKRLATDTLYRKLFTNAFPHQKEPISFPNIIKALASFVRTLKSENSPYNKFIKGDSAALSSSAKAGMILFLSNRLNCSSCHIPPFLTIATRTTNTDSTYFNTGLYNVLNKNKYPAEDMGLAAITHKREDDGKFKVPSLGNVALTAPYMHDGSINTLEEVVDMYQRGGRLINTGPYAGDGRNNTLKHKLISGFPISAKEKNELLVFLYSLTDSSVLTNTRFQNPFNLNNK